MSLPVLVTIDTCSVSSIRRTCEPSPPPHPRGHVSCHGPLQEVISLRFHGNSTPAISKRQVQVHIQVLVVSSLPWYSLNIQHGGCAIDVPLGWHSTITYSLYFGLLQISVIASIYHKKMFGEGQEYDSQKCLNMEGQPGTSSSCQYMDRISNA